MNSKLQQYVIASLASSGVVVLDSRIAFRLRGGDLWATAQNCGSDFGDPRLESFLLARGACLYLAHVDGRPEPLKVAAWSSDMLAQRVTWLVGDPVRSVEAVRTFAPSAPAETASAKHVPPEIPPYPCVQRANYFADRGEKDPVFETGRQRRPQQQA